MDLNKDPEYCLFHYITPYSHLAHIPGLVGEGLWEESLHDLVVESCMDIIKDVPQKIYSWMLPTSSGEKPKDSEQLMSDIKEQLLKRLPYIQSIAEKQGKKFIVSDKVSSFYIARYPVWDLYMVQV